MWFGTRAYMQEIATPKPGADYSPVGFDESTPWDNGRIHVNRSAGSHREYFFDWGAISWERARQILDYADGVYGQEDLFLIAPGTADQNVLPQSWATPSIAGHDGVALAGDDRPVLTANTDQTQGYPAEKATYTLDVDTVLRSVFVPIPPGHSAWVGVHGDAGAQDRVKITPFTGATAGAVVHPTVLTVSTTTRVNTEVTGTGLELSLDNSTPGDCPIVGMIVQLLPTGQAPAEGGFISGQGNAGCQFEGRPTLVPLVLGEQSWVRVSAKLVEVG